MSNVISLKMKIAAPNSHNFSSGASIYPFPFVSTNSISSLSYSNNKINLLPLRRAYIKAFTNSVQHLDSSPSSLHLEPISTESHFDQLISHPQRLQELLVIVWMASWCRKCIYLKPKLQKLAADYFPRVRFYCIDVNNVPHKLVVRAGVTKMPTVQVWKDGKKQGEVIGGHKAYLVVNEVREMIENEHNL